MTHPTFNGARFAGRPLLMHAPRMADLLGTTAPVDDRGAFSRFMDSISFGHEARALKQKIVQRTEEKEAVAKLYCPVGGEDVIEGQGRYVIADEIAVMDIEGPLLDRCCYYGASYDRIAETLNAIADDDRAKAVFIRLDSPGGLVAGLHEAAAALDALRATGKVIHVYTPSICASAAMWLASAADQIIAAPTAVLGSIGVVWVHWDESAWLTKMGIEVTPIQFGDKKTDAAWWKELSEQAQADAQAEIDTIGEMFVSAIADGRGLDAQVIRDQQAGVFMGEAAIKAGLADTVMLEGPAFAALRDQINTSSEGVPAAVPAAASAAAKAQSRTTPAADPCSNSAACARDSTQQKGSVEMSLKSTLAKILGGKAKNLSAGQLSRIRAAAEKDKKDPEAEDGTEDEDPAAMDGEEDDGEDATDSADPADPDPDVDGDGEEDDDEDGDGADNVEAKVLRRVTAITGCKEAKGREKLAGKLAAQPGMTVKTAQSILRCAPKASSLAAAMDGQDPVIANQGGNPATQSSTVARATARWGKAKHSRK